MVPTGELRSAVADLASVAVRLPDEAMDSPYAWREYESEGLRFALLTAYHELAGLSMKLAAERGRSTGSQLILGGFVDAHADLDGLLASASDQELDRAPADGEWPLREVVAHVLQSEKGFLGACRRGLKLAGEGLPPSPLAGPDWAAFGASPAPEGGREAVRSRLLASRDAVIGEFHAVTDVDLALPVYFWESEAFPLRFRLIRFELHLRQHTVQADKTMAGIGHGPSEAERLTRLVIRGLGAVEAALIGAPNGFGRAMISDTVPAVSDLREALAKPSSA